MQKDTILRRQLFVALGLSDKEAILYDTLLKYGQLPAASLERITGLKKNTYILLKSLAKRGLVQKMIKDGKSHYIVGSPKKLELYARELEQRVSETRGMLTEMLPVLKSEYRAITNSPVVEYLYGEMGVREAFEQVYSENKKEIYGCVGWLEPSKILSEITNRFAGLRVERGIKTFAINNDTMASREFAKKATDPANLAEVYLVDKEKYPLPVEVDVWNETVALMSFADEDFQSILIHHPQIATTIKSLFILLFDLLRERKRAREKFKDGKE